MGTTKSMLILNKDLFIGEGGNRSVYDHPEEGNLCIKILHTNCGSEPLHCQKREINVYKKIERRRIPSNHFAKYLGTVDTNLGRGYVYEKVMDYDGKVSTDLYSYLSSLSERNEEILEALRELGKFVVRERIFFGDPREGNILYQKTSEKSYELVIVDGLGDHVFISVSQWIPSVERSRIMKKWNAYLAKKISKVIPWIEESDLTLQ